MTPAPSTDPRKGWPDEVADGVVRSLLGDARRVVVKVGSQVLCRPAGRIDDTVFEALCRVIAELMAAGRGVVLVSSGAVALGRGVVGQVPGAADRGASGTLGKQALAAIGQSLLMSRYRSQFGMRGVDVAQLLLTHSDLGDRRRFLHARRVTADLLGAGVLPIVNENDTVAVEEIRFGDNDALAGQVAQLVEAQALVLLTEVAGLYTADPQLDPQARLLSAVSARDERVLDVAGEGGGKFGTGGMRSKVIAARTAAEVGIITVVADGRDPLRLHALLAGGAVGTVFVPPRRKLTGRRKWIMSSVRARGDVIVDPGARAALVQNGRSLLPAGVVAVHGRFGVGDAVRVKDVDGNLLGRGLSRYDAEDARRVLGQRTDRIAEVLGWLPARELIHRDDFVAARGVGER